MYTLYIYTDITNHGSFYEKARSCVHYQTYNDLIKALANYKKSPDRYKIDSIFFEKEITGQEYDIIVQEAANVNLFEVEKKEEIINLVAQLAGDKELVDDLFDEKDALEKDIYDSISKMMIKADKLRDLLNGLTLEERKLANLINIPVFEGGSIWEFADKIRSSYKKVG